MKRKNRRWRLLADLKIQGGMCARVIAYWLICQGLMCATIAVLASLEGPASGGSALRFLMPAFHVSLCALPLALLDTLIFTNRVVGPLFSFRRQFQQLAKSQNVEELHFRKGDFFADLAENFNRVRKIVKQQQPAEAVTNNLSPDSDPIAVG